MQRTAAPNLETALERAAPSRSQWHAWTRGDPALAGLTYRDVRRELRTGDQDRKDRLLGALVRVTRADPDAFAVVAACLLPALRRRVRLYGPSLDRDDALAVMIEGLYEAVARADATLNAFVATYLLSVPTRRLRRAVSHERAWDRISRPECPGPSADAAVIGPSAHTMLAGAVAAGVLSPADAQLIVDTRIAGHSLRAAARRLGLPYEAAKKRRQRAEPRWVSWWTTNTDRSPFEDVA
jgi:DNA-directed RNA polymerase specialized sigma24 family protein